MRKIFCGRSSGVLLAEAQTCSLSPSASCCGQSCLAPQPLVTLVGPSQMRQCNIPSKPPTSGPSLSSSSTPKTLLTCLWPGLQQSSANQSPSAPPITLAQHSPSCSCASCPVVHVASTCTKPHHLWDENQSDLEEIAENCQPSVHVVKLQNKLPRKMVDAPFLSVFKRCSGSVLNNCVGFMWQGEKNPAADPCQRKDSSRWCQKTHYWPEPSH